MTILGRVARLEGDIDDAEACFRHADALQRQSAQAARGQGPLPRHAL